MQLRNLMADADKTVVTYNRHDKAQVNAILRLVDEFIDSEDKSNTAERILSRGTVKLLKVGKEYVGFLIYVHNTHKGIYHISYICVGKNFRSKGYGEYLLRDFISSHDNVFIGVRSENSIAIKLYKKVGFKVIQTGREEGMNFTLLKYTRPN